MLDQAATIVVISAGVVASIGGLLGAAKTAAGLSDRRRDRKAHERTETDDKSMGLITDPAEVRREMKRIKDHRFQDEFRINRYRKNQWLIIIAAIILVFVLVSLIL